MVSIRAENLIIVGKFLIPLSKIGDKELNQELRTNLKKKIVKVMRQRGFLEAEDIRTEFLISSYFQKLPELPNVLEFIPPTLVSADRIKIPHILRLKKAVGLISEEDIVDWKYSRALMDTRDVIPWRIKIRIHPIDRGFFVEVEMYPAIYFKIVQLGYRPSISEFEYSSLIQENSSFLRDILIELNGEELEAPRPIGSIVEKDLLGKLHKFKFSKVASLLEDAIGKLDKGEIEDSLAILRSVLEKFLEYLVIQIGEKPQERFHRNLEILKSRGYLEDKVTSLLDNTLYEFVYRYLSNKIVHKREKLNIEDAKFLFNISYDIMDYLIEKVILRK